MLWINGNLQTDSKVEYNSALRWADGVGTSFRVQSGRFLGEQLHFDRLKLGAQWLSAPEKFTQELYQQFVLAPLRASQQLVTPEDETIFWKIQVGLYYFEGAFQCIMSAQIVHQTKGCELHQLIQSPQNYFVGTGNLAKPLSYGGVERIRRNLKLEQSVDFLWGSNGEIYESSTSSLLLVLNKRVLTSNNPMVESVMLKYLNLNGVAIERVAINLDTILRADEILLINSVQQLVAVKKFRERIYTRYLDADSKTEFLISKFGDLWTNPN
jgi:branched-subunit amino acid aminotransferase/4-amino-4-deoxychorismate lyase